eukprot:comp17653_c0_seq1/m.17429 comp17653_c0_seq1/g.17429  ORF comp17653_c0_seq1/g.17429 comp17653_c0_seq1/m.17429 type:complete len:485 (-) comp17653_c0_seq1:334-1788(-)
MVPRLFALLSAAWAVNACSELMTQYNIDTNPTSARTMDWGMPDLLSELLVKPRGAPIATFPIRDCPTCKLPSLETKYGYACMNAFHEDICGDGLNEMGLSVAALALKATKYPRYTDADKRPIFPLYSLPAYLLGTCDSIDCVKTEVGAWQIADAVVPGFAAFNEKFKGAYPSNTMPVHLSVHDAKGRSVVIEFIDSEKNATAPLCFNNNPSVFYPQAGARLCVYDNNDLQVLTNDPNFEQMTNNVLGRMNITSSDKLDTVPNEVLFTAQKGAGSYAPDDRFTQLVVLQQYAQRASGEWVPGLLDPSFVSSNRDTDAIAGASQFIGRVTRVIGGDIVHTGDWTTTYVTIRDHKNGKYYFKTPANPNFQVVDLTDPLLALQDNQTTRKAVALNYNSDQPFANVVSYPLMASAPPTSNSCGSQYQEVFLGFNSRELIMLGLLIGNVLLTIVVMFCVCLRRGKKQLATYNIYQDGQQDNKSQVHLLGK